MYRVNKYYFDPISFRQLLEQVTKIQKQNNKMKIELDERRNEAERFKALQNHSSHQQVLLNQLRSRLEEHEYVFLHQINPLYTNEFCHWSWYNESGMINF